MLPMPRHATNRRDDDLTPRSAVRLRLAVLAFAVTAATVQGQAPAEAPAQQPTFRGGANYVRVDMYPSLDGTIVTDLRPEEVQVFEDGAPQQIDTFEHVRIPPGGPEALRIEPNSILASQQAATDPRARVFVVFLDTYHTDVQVAQQLRDPIRRFLEEALGPDDLVAVITAEMPTSALAFTRRTTVLSGILEQTGEWLKRDATIHRFDDRERLYEECYGPGDIAAELIARRREKLTLDAIEQLSTYLGIVRDERKAVLVVTKGWRLFERSETLQSSPFGDRVPLRPDDRLRGGRGRDGNELNANSDAIAQCEADRMSLAQIEHRARLQEITGVANRSNVSFYPFSPLRVQSTLAMMSNLRGLAEDTDGLSVVNTNSFGEHIRRIIADTSSYYLIGYQSSNSRLDGRFRRISVRVTRPGVDVRARHGYRALSGSDVRAAERGAAANAPPRVDRSITTALGRMGAVNTAVPLRLRTASWTQSGGAGRVWLVGELDASTRRASGWDLGAQGEMTMLAADGAPVASTTIEIAKGGTTFVVGGSDIGTVAPGDYQIRVRLRAAGPSDGPLTDTVRVTVPAASTLGEPVVLRRGPQTGLAYLPTADARFRRNERLRLELPTSAAAAPATARFLDRTGKPLQAPAAVTMRNEAGTGVTWIVVDSPVSPFAAGDYLVEVTQEGASQMVAFRVVS